MQESTEEVKYSGPKEEYIKTQQTLKQVGGAWYGQDPDHFPSSMTQNSYQHMYIDQRAAKENWSKLRKLYTLSQLSPGKSKEFAPLFLHKKDVFKLRELYNKAIEKTWFKGSFEEFLSYILLEAVKNKTILSLN